MAQQNTCVAYQPLAKGGRKIITISAGLLDDRITNNKKETDLDAGGRRGVRGAYLLT